MGAKATATMVLSLLGKEGVTAAEKFATAESLRNFLAAVKGAILDLGWAKQSNLSECAPLHAPSRQTKESAFEFLERSGLLPFYGAFANHDEK